MPRLWQSVVLLVWLAFGAGGPLCARAETAGSWGPAQTRLANEYLQLLSADPQDERLVTLLWELYARHEATGLLLRSVLEQAKAQGDAGLYLLLGHLQRRDGRAEAALQSYQRALTLATGTMRQQAFKALADVSMQRGELREAAGFVEQRLRLPELGVAQQRQAWLELGTLRWRADESDKAQQAWRRAAALAGEDAAFLELLAQQSIQAGALDLSIELLRRLGAMGAAAQRVAALGRLAQLHELRSEFTEGDAALLAALGLLDFRDALYEDLFKRRVRLHEHAGWLEKLGAELHKARQRGDLRALLDWVRYCRSIADVDGEMQGLEALLAKAPQWDEYRWQLVRLMLDHQGAESAAKMLDERLRLGGEHPLPLTLLRCEADLRLGKTDAAVQRLRQLLRQGGDETQQRQILAFARDRALDDIVLEVLRLRVALRGDDAKLVFELASFLRGRGQEEQAQAALKDYVQASASDAQRGQRVAEVAGFLSASAPGGQILEMLRAAAQRKAAQREDFIRLADVLSQSAKGSAEARQWLERAWQASVSDEEAMDVDERLWALLNGAPPSSQVLRGTAGEFQLPEVFSGKGFASDESAPVAAVSAEAVAMASSLARELKAARAPDWRQGQRALWWTLRCGLLQKAYDLYARMQKIAPPPLGAQRLLLQLALEDENMALSLRLLRRLIQIDVEWRERHVLRLAELLLKDEQQGQAALNLGLSHERTGWRWVGEPEPAGKAAVELLERMLLQSPNSEALLHALTQCLALQRRLPEAWKRWRAAINSAPDASAASLLERHAQLRLERGDWQAYVQSQVEWLARQRDVLRRREWFKRFMDRLMWAGEGSRELDEQDQNHRLETVADALDELSKRAPLDAFYLEALAQVWLRRGDLSKAFSAMQRAYYLAPETPFSLEQLRDLASRSNQVDQALAFQRQVVASAPAERVAAESRRLVEMLEAALQIEQADRVRRNLESRFSQDAAALEELASHYESSGQDEAQRRVYEQIARVRPWDARSSLRLALKCLRLADDAAAQGYLDDLLSRTDRHPVMPGAASLESLPLPWVEGRGSGPVSVLAPLVNSLDTAPGLRSPEIAALRALLSAPRPWLSLLPQSEAHLRLRAIEEWSALQVRQGALASWQKRWASLKSPLERFWAALAAQRWKEALGELRSLSADRLTPRVESSFILLWLMLRCHGMQDAIDWSQQTAVAGEWLDLRQRCLLGVVGMMADLPGLRFAPGELELAGRVGSAAMLAVMRRLQEAQRYAEALELGESLRRHQRSLGGAFVFSLARIAESAERWDLARHYLSEVVDSPVRPEAYRGTYDPYLFSLGAAHRLASDAGQREADWRRAWARLQATEDSAMTRLRKAAVAGFAGSSQPAVAELSGLWTGDFLWSRALGEVSGALVPQGSTRGDEALHQRSYWEEVREMQARMVQEGLGPLVQQANEVMMQRFGGSAHNPRTGMEFGQWRFSQLLRRMRTVNHPTRQRLLREFLGPVEMSSELAVEALGDLGAKLEGASMAREAVGIYAMLPARAPANPEYAQSLLRAAETAMDTEMGLRFSLQLLLAEPPYKPPQPGDEVLREKHARFLAWDLDVGGLHERAWVEQPTRVLRGRVPHEVPYLRELALLYEKCGLKLQAAQCWQRLLQAHVANADHGLVMDWDACLHLARLELDLGHQAQALVALQPIDLKPKLGTHAVQALALRARIYEQQRRWEDFRQLLPLALALGHVELMIELGERAARWGHRPEALDFVVRAERAAKDDLARFDLRLAQLQLLAADDGWMPGGSGPQISILLRLQPRQPEALRRCLKWLGSESGRGPRREAWLQVLRAESLAGSDPLLATTMASVFFKGRWPQPWSTRAAQVWSRALESDRSCLELAAEWLLGQGDAALAQKAVEVIEGLPSARLEGRKTPLMLRVAHANQLRGRVMDLFAEVVRMPPASGSKIETWALAFEQCEAPGLARELFERAMKQMDQTQSLQPELVAGWCRFLRRQKDYEIAESVLVQWHWCLQGEVVDAIFGLYEDWGRLPQLERELGKYHLAGGLLRELQWRAAKSLGQPLPLRGLNAGLNPGSGQ